MMRVRNNSRVDLNHSQPHRPSLLHPHRLARDEIEPAAAAASSSSLALVTTVDDTTMIETTAAAATPMDDAPISRIRHTNTRRALRSTNHIGLLASAETQLMMQMLDVKSLLKLARCNRRLLADASCAFAWKGKSFECRFDKNSLDRSTIFNRSLLRFVPLLYVKWMSSWAPSPPSTEDVTVGVNVESAIV